VVFDLGGVLIDWDPRYLYRRLLSDEHEVERFLTEVCTWDWHTQHDLGRPFAETSAELIERFPEHAELIRAWGRQEEMIAGEISESVEVLRELLGRGVRCLALTNWSWEWFHARMEEFEFLRWFEGIVASGFEGIAKPDPEIYRRLLDRYGVRAAETLFVDDSPANVEGAAAVGMHAHRFVSPDTLRAELIRLSLLEG
jgi:2-haloacid dehalogenase